MQRTFGMQLPDTVYLPHARRPRAATKSSASGDHIKTYKKIASALAGGFLGGAVVSAAKRGLLQGASLRSKL